MTGDRPMTVDAMVRDPAVVRARVARMLELQRTASSLLPQPDLPPLTRRYRARRWFRTRRDSAREAVARQLAPWLVNRDDLDPEDWA